MPRRLRARIVLAAPWALRGGILGGILGAPLGGCWNESKDEWQCIGPAVEVMQWRDQRETARTLGREVMTPAELARQELEHVEAAAAALKPRRGFCELTWSVMMHVPADNPGLRLREEALLRVLELPPRDYPPNAVGWAGVTTAGRTPTAPGR
ncbi:MAG: hypothetical protein Q8P18_21720 [Pseudomonadota bacterium]|nr:hypothetical protein [Pseudomonadota bacterium]